MKVKEVSWKSGFVSRGVQCDEAFAYTEQLRAKHGGELTTAQVLDAAKRTNSPIHDLFEWSDSKAAKAFRLRQAGDLIRSFHVVYEEAPERVHRAYEVVKRPPVGEKNLGGKKTFYSTTDEIMCDPEKRDTLVLDALRQLTSWRRKFAGLTELQEVIDSIDKAIKEVAACGS